MALGLPAAAVRPLVRALVLAGALACILFQWRESVAAQAPQAGTLTIRDVSQDTGLATFASASGAGIDLPFQAASAEERAALFIDLYGARFGLADRSAVALVGQPHTDELGLQHVRFRQLHNGVPITGAEFIVHLNGSRVVGANGHVADNLPDDVTPVVTPVEAQLQAMALVEKTTPEKAPGARYSDPRLEILDRRVFDNGAPGPQLAWFVEASGFDLRELAWVDARSGGVLFHFSQIEEASNRKVYTAHHSTSLPGILVRSEGGASTGDADQDNAYLYSGHTYDYYLSNHGRDSYDNAGAAIVSSAHYGVNYANAFWNGSQMVYGEGFASADDVVAHELTHAVTGRSAGLYYYNQSGALNESFSDIFGETIDLLNGSGSDGEPQRWLMGEDLPIGAIRNLMTPTAFGDPGKMSDGSYVCSTNAYSGGSDNGGVHTNSGLPNHAYALMVDGGTYNGRTIAGIGLTKAGKIEYRALTVYLTSGSGFKDAYNALSQSCSDLVGTAGISSEDCAQVTAALQAVEMNGTVNCPGAVAAPAMCPAGATSTLFADTFETASAQWSAGSTTSTNWSRQTFFTKSGIYAARGPDPSVTSDHQMSMATAVTLPAAARLYVDHAFEFDGSLSAAFDGGVIEYSTNNGSTWTDAASLIDAGQGYNGTISSSFGNPLGGRTAFVKSTYGYTGTRLNLSSLAGQGVKFRFRVATDSTVGSLGWLVDNVAIYTCSASDPGDTAPTISAIANQTIAEDGSTGAIAVTVGDAETAPASLTVTATSSNTALVPNANLAVGGSGATRTVAATPAANQNGTTVVTVTVSDGTLSASASFALTVTPVNDAPTISAIAAQTTAEDTPTGAIAVTIGDVETSASGLTVSATSSNTTLVPNAGLALAGNGADRTIVATPAADQSGSTTITITVSDGAASATTAFVLTVTAVNDAPTISPISTQTTTTDASTPSIAFTVGDVDTPTTSLTLSAASSDTTLVPLNHIVFGGSGPNRLVVVTPAATQNGAVTITITVSDGGLSASTSFVVTVVAVNHAPTISSIASVAINEDAVTPALSFTIDDGETPPASLAVSATSSNAALVPAAGVALAGGGANRTVTVTPAPNQSGTSTITVTVSDGSLSAAAAFTVTVMPVNDTPTISSIPSQITTRDAATSAIPFTIGDVETPASGLTIAAVSSNVALVPVSNVAIGGSGANRTVTVIPAAGRTGAAAITLTVSDGAASASATFTVAVNGTTDLQMALESPATGATIARGFSVSGWVADIGAGSGTGVDAIHVYAYAIVGGTLESPTFLGQAVYGSARPDVGAILGSQFTNSGFALNATLPLGRYRIVAYARSTLTGTFAVQRSADIAVAPPVSRPTMSLDRPSGGSTTRLSFVVSGWAVDRGADTGPGIEAVHVYAYRLVNGSFGSPVFLGAARYGLSRPDVASAFGAQFQNSGFTLRASNLDPGSYRVVAYARSVVAGAFNQQRAADITVAAPDSLPRMSLDGPTPGSIVVQPFITGGWALDLAADSGTGVDAVHVWAFPIDGRPARFVDQASLGGRRDDVAAVFGPQFAAAAFNFLMTGLSPGTYDIGVYAHSTVTGTFNQARFSRVTIVGPASNPGDAPGSRQLGFDVPAPIVEPETGMSDNPFDMAVDAPRAEKQRAGELTVAGWAVDRRASADSGIGGVHVFARPQGQPDAPPIFLGAATMGVARPDVGDVYGRQFDLSGWIVTTPSLSPGDYDILVYAWSAGTGRVEISRVVPVMLR